MSPRMLMPALLLSVASLAGCQKAPPAMPPPKPPEVTVGRAIEDTVTDFEEFTGRTEAVEVVEVRPRVGGQLDDVMFKEGADVKQDQPLARIDPKPLQGELDRAKANLGQAEERIKRLQQDYERIRSLPKGTASPQEYDKVVGDLNEAVKAVKSAEATRNIAKLNFDFTTITAPISGRISRRLIERGNMVKAEETALAVIVSLDPVYASFDVDERTYRRMQQFLEQKGVPPEKRKKLPVFMGLSDEKDYPHQGAINFVDNRVDPNTGSVWVRGTFVNPDKTITPGLFARIRLPVGEPHKAVLIPERALSTDQGQKFAFVVNDQNEAVKRAVELGSLHPQGREVLKGIQPGERLVVNGLQRVREGAKVEPKDEPVGEKVRMPGTK